MKALLLTFFSCLFFFISFFVQAQENMGHTWSKVFNNSSPTGGNIEGRSIKVDAAGNTYVTGNFSSTADFDPGTGIFNLTSSVAADIFIAKYDAANNLLFAKAIGGSAGNDVATCLVLDAANNIYVTGYFEGTVDFDPGAGTANLTSAGGSDIFLAKYDPNGNLVYAKSMGGTSSDQSNGLAVDASGNSYITGRFVGPADFDPGAGTVNLFSVSGSVDIFLAKYDAGGNYVFAKQISGSGTESGDGLAIDATNNIYITGSFQNTVDFDPGVGTANLTSVSTSDGYFAKYTTDGDYVYAKQISGGSSVTSIGIAVDGNSNLYITGNYSATVDFDPGAGTANLTPAGGTDIFFAKYDTNGNYVYAKTVGGTNNETGFALTTDANGNAYVSGYYSGSVDLDPGAGTSNFTSAGGNDYLFAKYDASGNYVYAKSVGGTGMDRAYSIATDANSKVYVTGIFRSSVDFDPGAGTATLNGPTTVSNCFIAAYDASGNYSYAGSLGGYSNSVFKEEGKSIAVDGSGNVYVTGYFEGTVDFDPGVGTTNLTVAGNNDIYLAKYDANGNLVYVRSFGSTGFDVGTSVTADASGNVYITGWFNNTVDFDPGSGTANLTSAGSNDVFLAKYDANGNYVYAIGFGGTSVDAGFSLKIDGSGNAYVAGQFSNTVDFDPGVGTANLTSAGATDIFFAKYDASGNYVFAKRMGGTNNDQATGVALDAAGNIYLSAVFGNTADFDPGAGTVNLVSAGLSDIAVAKYNTAGDYVYAFSIGSSSIDQANAIGVDASGNVYMTGTFTGSVDFDPGAGLAALTSTASSSDMFFAKYDASGNYVFAQKIGATGGEMGNGLEIDGAGNIYITGYFNTTVDFDPGPGTAELIPTGSLGQTDIFLAKYTTNGTYVFAQNIGGTGSDNSYSLALDGSNHIYIHGYIAGTADADPSTETINVQANNGNDLFIAKYSICSSPSLSAQTISARPAAVSGATSLTDGGCRLLAVVEPNGASPVSGTVNAQLWIESSVPVYAGQPFVARHYEITPVTNPSTATGRVTLYFTQQEFTDFNDHPASTLNLPTGAADAAGISNLRIGKYNGTSNNGTGLPGSYTNGSSIIDPVDADIVWNATLSRWEVSFNVTGFSGFIVQTVSSTLPVTLLEFQAQRKVQTTLLTWSTASEQNNKGFTIQRSTNGQNFTDLGFVPAATNGNSAVTQSYRFTDAVPLNGRNYYRLLQQDDNGRSKSSEIRIVDFSDKMVIAMYPNPAASVLNISISATSNESLLLRITDVTARVLKTKNYNNASGTIQLNIDDLAKGTYFLELWMNNEKQVYSFIKQ